MQHSNAYTLHTLVREWKKHRERKVSWHGRLLPSWLTDQPADLRFTCTPHGNRLAPVGNFYPPSAADSSRLYDAPHTCAGLAGRVVNGGATFMALESDKWQVAGHLDRPARECVVWFFGANKLATFHNLAKPAMDCCSAFLWAMVWFA